MDAFQPSLEWIDAQADRLVEQLSGWAAINSHTFNREGVDRVRKHIAQAFKPLSDSLQTTTLDPYEYINSQGQKEQRSLADGLLVTVRPQAARRVLLVCHMDTVYPADHPFQQLTQLNPTTLRGPGVTDAKGGISVILAALSAFERFEHKDAVGWTVFLNTDEEIGSPGSRRLLQTLAGQHHAGLVYEPSLPDGNLVGARKGSANFTLVVYGKSAHAGRDIHLGRNAVNLLAQCITEINKMQSTRQGLTVNIGMIEGGRALNVVPDVAIARFNIRIEKPEDEAHVWVDLKRIMAQAGDVEGLTLELHGGFFAPPKVLDKPAQNLFGLIRDCGRDLGMPLEWKSSGGVCDGNRLAAFGLPNVDTLGVCGGDIHSSQEYLDIPSLAQRAKLSALFLMKLAAGEIQLGDKT